MDKKLRVSHYPQIPCEPFITEVKTLEEAKKLIDVLANYDLFQYKNSIKGDYANMTLLEEWNEYDNEWIDWSDDETGIDDLDEYFEFINEEEK